MSTKAFFKDGCPPRGTAPSTCLFLTPRGALWFGQCKYRSKVMRKTIMSELDGRWRDKLRKE